jgi:protein-disulfide isomerase
LPAAPLSIAGAALRGDPAAKVVVIEYSDLECPYSGVFAREIAPAIDEAYVKTGRVQWAFRHLPLSFHQNAVKAAEAVECAGRQGKRWELQRTLFANQKQLDPVSLRAHAATAQLTLKDFDLCLAGQMAAIVQAHAAEARELRVNGTPTFFLGLRQADGTVKVTRRLSGARPVAEFQAALDTLLK